MATATRPGIAPADLLTGVHHLELYVGNARAVTHLLVSAYGFACTGYLGPETGVRDKVSYLLEQGEIALLVTAGLGPASPVTAHVARHGDGVAAIGLGCLDPAAALEEALRRGASEAPGAALAAYGDTRFEFVAAGAARDERWPALRGEGLPHARPAPAVGLERIDHVVANVEEGRLEEWVAWHERVLGLKEMTRFGAEQISTEYSALRSTVVYDGGAVVLPINEPAPGRAKSQIEEYLEAYGGPGVQHVALRTSDIVRSVGELARRGVRFLVPPPDYYEAARRRLPGVALAWEEIERLGILVDVEAGGYLLQVFTEPLGDRPTLFFEVIERRGAEGFGEGNFKALFEAIEREQARRGNL